MLHSLYGKLVAALLALLGLISLLYIALSLLTIRFYLQEVNQKLHQSLAANIVQQELLLRNQEINQEALQEVFHMLMIINPSIEVYLLDARGKILAYSAPPGEVKRSRVSLEPIRMFLAGSQEYPLHGDDPRDTQRQKVFSAAPIYDTGQLQGYLYVVLGGQEYDSVIKMVQGSYIFRLSAGMTAASVLLTLIAGLLSLRWLTQRLRRLTEVMESFKQGDFRRPVAMPEWNRGPRADEIDRLGVTFEQMSERITQQISQVQSADASRRELVASVSHDLRTPLASLQGYLETLLIKESTLSPEEKHQYLELATLHCQRLGRLVADLFELTILEAQETPLHVEPFSLGELTQDVTQNFRLEAGRKRISLEVDIPENAPFVSGEIGLIERVLENLLENAIKYTPEGGTIHLGLVHKHNQIVARITDSGPGIPEQDLPHIFERFYRVERHHPDEPVGTGLGLAIVQRILQLHRSSIEVESKVGHGTTFTFQLPVHHA